MARKKRNVVAEFDRYFGDDNLHNWQRMCSDIGLDGDLSSINKCKKAKRTSYSFALEDVWVNIVDFLNAIKQDPPTKPKRFDTQNELAVHTREKKRYYPRDEAKKSKPVRALLAHIVGRG
ncbi:hypothetical protein LSUE1_G004912 [Lachnellula suecica]|uniref:Uncharacterized protein n=1 Tax=Lachnellula suecica TaxID=602035 RepID=A0A8T9C628_9HELO|nr:hypothetical protein LSUE1_G004912 [Lachnellula suecica]